MNSVLRHPAVSPNRHQLGSPTVDPAFEAELERAHRAGFDEGFAEGARAAEAAGRETERRAIAAIEQATAQATAAIRRSIEATVPEVVALALGIARRVVADLPAGTDQDLVARIEAALAEIADDPLVLRINPADAATVSALVAQASNLQIEPDESLDRGDALIVGRWARADLTLDTAWRLVEKELMP